MLCNCFNYTTVKYFLCDYDYLIIIASMKEMLRNGVGLSVISWAACAYSKRKKIE